MITPSPLESNMSTAPTELEIYNAIEHFPYETALFQQCWWQTLASRFDIPVKVGDLLICRKRI